MENIMVLLFLSIGAIWDLRKKSVPKGYLLIWGFVTFGYLIASSVREMSVEIWINAVWGLIPGLVCLFLAYVSREQIGFGDGWIIMLLGIILGLKTVLAVLFMALSVLTMIAIALLILKKVTRKTTLPFIPFLFIGFILTLIIRRFL